jgi:glutaminyl-peptide cyclotransferase
LPPGLFGEGLARLGDRLVQLTWRGELALVYALEPLRLVDCWAYSGPGWGLTAFPGGLVMSDGSSSLVFRGPDFAPLRRITVVDHDQVVQNLNELEWVKTKIWANVWPQDRIAIIDPVTGQVQVWLDCSSLRQRLSACKGAGVLNGIAYDPKRQLVYLTGKHWPVLFSFELSKVDWPDPLLESYGSSRSRRATSSPEKEN